MLPTPPRDLKSKKEGYFRGQGIKFDRKIPKYGNGFFGQSYAKITQVPNVLYTPPTLPIPCIFACCLRPAHWAALACLTKISGDGYLPEFL